MYNEIIDEIKSNLTGNKEKDKEFLKSQMVKYADSDYGQEIVLEIGRLMWDFLSDEEKSEFIKISDNENPIKDAFMEAKHYIDLHDLKTALNILDSFFKIFPFGFNDDKINEYHSFSNPFVTSQTLIFSGFPEVSSFSLSCTKRSIFFHICPGKRCQTRCQRGALAPPVFSGVFDIFSINKLIQTEAF